MIHHSYIIINLSTTDLNINVLDFNFQHYPPKEEELESQGLACMPRRTVIKLETHQDTMGKGSDEESVEDSETRRSHMNAGQINSEKCKVCVCAVDGKMEYCSRRPARNINECIRMAALTEQLQKNIPYGHEATLAFRIRRGLFVDLKNSAAEICNAKFHCCNMKKLVV